MTDLIARAVTLREAQDMEAALEEISKAAKQNPDDPRAALGLAQISFEAWRPAAALFAKARTLMPGNADALRNHALALAAEGQSDAAEALLEAALLQAPGWLDGHRVLAAQRYTNGQKDGFDRSYADAVRRDSDNAALRMAWFQQHATVKNWKRAGAILADARKALPDHPSLKLADLFLASESGEARSDATLFDTYAELKDPGLDLAQVRHHLRGGDPERAEAIAARHVGGPVARMFWPYLSLCWRMMDDPRAGWLDGDPLYCATFDLDFSAAELSALADVLRSLHRMKAPYPEQSVDGGTQTDRQLFFHPNAAIQAARAKVSAAVAAYIEGLPAPDAAHSLLSPPRDQPLRFEGSWSVRLTGAGYHHSHTHVLGWISSALYLALPDGDDNGKLAFGAPPPELELPLQTYRHIEPKAGRLALFPSTLWHCTEPFAAGERLTIAFDVKLPAV
ncbi:MAG: putative 2OG-Fe(II) oxygenase [Sphingorhabdus sp.]